MPTRMDQSADLSANRPPYRALFLPTGINSLCQSVSLLLVGLLALVLAANDPASLTGRLAEVLAEGSTGGDFITFYSAGQLYARYRDASPYDLDRLREAQLTAAPPLRSNPGWLAAGGVKAYKNPPFYLPVLGLFAHFSLPIAFVLSTALQAALLGMLLTITAGLATGRAVPLAGTIWIVLNLAYYPIWEGLAEAQIPACIAALALAAGILLLRAGRPGWAGLAFAFLVIKPQYLPPLVLFLLAARERQVLVGYLAGSSVLGLLSVALVGPGGLRLYLESMVQLATAPRELYFDHYEWMFNWRALLERVLMRSHPDLILPSQFLLVALTYGLAFWSWTAPTRSGAWRRDLGILVLALTMILAAPHAHGHDLLLLMPAVALVMNSCWQETLPWPVTLTSALGLLLFYRLLPQQLLISPSLHFSVLLVAVLFLSSTFALRSQGSWLKVTSRSNP